MTDLGALGTAKPDDEGVEIVEVTFDYFGQKIHANPELSELDYIDYMHIVGSLDPDNPVSFGRVKEFAMLCIVPEDFALFWKTAKRNRQNANDLFEVCKAIMEAVTDRPTGLPSDSVDGPTNTDTSSVDVTSLERLRGRPDLQLLVQQALTG